MVRIGHMLLRKGEIEFLVKFLCLFFGLFILMRALDLSALLEAIANLEYGMLKVLGINTALSGTLIYIGRRTVEIVPECSGLFMPILLAALLWSTKIDNSRRVKYLLIFTPLLFLFNLFRIYITILPLAYMPALFSPIHIFMWFVDSAIVLAIWMRAQGIRISDLLPNESIKKKGNNK